MKGFVSKLLLCVVFFLPTIFYLTNPKKIESAPPTNFKDQLSSGQLSYYQTLSTGTTAGSSIIYTNINNFNLDIGDTLGSGNFSNQYIVTGLVGDNGISLDRPIEGSDATINNFISVRHYTTHTVSFSPQSSVTGGKWQILIRGDSFPTSGWTNNTGFDLGTLTTSAITCPWGNQTATDIGTTTIINANPYLVITCPLPVGGTNPVGIGSTGTIVIGDSNHMLLNPSSPSTSSGIGQAETFLVILRHLDSTGTVIDEDTTAGKIALNESVRVTATVDPTITFSVGNSGVTTAGTNLCGSNLSSGATDTTATSVNFGSLNLAEFNNLAQFIQCTTNAVNGYVIQTFESNPLTMIGNNTTLPNTTCSPNSCSNTTSALWTDSSVSGFGYSLDVGSTSSGALLGITTTGQYKSFGIGYNNAQTILSRTNTPTGTDSAYICYRISISNLQPAGTYQNQINFIATATF